MNRANRSPSPGTAKEPTMNATYGPTSSTPFAHYDPDTHSLKTSQDTFDLGLTPSSPTLPKRGSMRNGQLYEQPTSAPPTGVTACSSLLPTPTASDAKRNDSPADRRRKSPGITTTTTHWPGLVELPTSTLNVNSAGE